MIAKLALLHKCACCARPLTHDAPGPSLFSLLSPSVRPYRISRSPSTGSSSRCAARAEMRGSPAYLHQISDEWPVEGALRGSLLVEGGEWLRRRARGEREEQLLAMAQGHADLA